MAPDIKSLYKYCFNSKIRMFKKDYDEFYTINITVFNPKNRAYFTISGKDFYSITINSKAYVLSGINDNNDNQNKNVIVDDISDLL